MISPRAIRMLTKQGFIGLFWEELAKQRKVEFTVTHEQVYESLESEYMAEFCQRRYANFESFISNRDR
jgi:hypothetical protein